MSLTYGFFDHIDGIPTYNANDMNQLLNGLIGDGVFKDINLGARENTCFMIQQDTKDRYLIGPGKSRFNDIWMINDSDFVIELDELTGNQAQWTIVYIEVNKTRAGRYSDIKYQNGTIGTTSSVTKPTIENEKDIYRRVISEIYRTAVIGECTSKVGEEGCPYVMNILDNPEIPIINNLTTTEPGKMLDARQGHELNLKAPFAFGVSNGMYGYIKDGTSTIIPF